MTRSPASQAAYGLFASTLDLGLIPFYVFTAYIAHREYTEDAYHWGNLFGFSAVTTPIAEATFICALANAGLHVISLALSIFLAVTFRKISRLPPDMNPLEDNLTARPKSSREQTNVNEKHMSSSTLNSNLEDPPIGPPRSVPFMHTRGQSMGVDSHRESAELMDEKRQSQVPVQLPQLPPSGPSGPDMLFHQRDDQPYDMASQTPAPEYRNVVKQLPDFVEPSTHERHLTSRSAERLNTVSPLSDNWAAYSDRSPSPMSDVQNQNGQNGTILRHSSSVYSRRTDATGASTGSGYGYRDLFAYGQRSAPSIGSVIHEDTRGEYASLAMHEFYGNDEDIDNNEQDLGDQRFNIAPDPAEHDHDIDDEPSNRLPFNPLMLNPPTPQPAIPEQPEDTDPVRRSALGDNPNLSNNQKAHVFVPHDDPGSPPTKSHFRGDGHEQLTRKPAMLSRKRSKKLSAYQSLKKDDSDDEGAGMAEGDRKGRVVSNSGADAPRTGLVSGVGASLSSYGSYIAGLGVGRRRDVSGKVAEEGRGGKEPEARPSPSPRQNQKQGPEPIRAAGWARFAGL